MPSQKDFLKILQTKFYISLYGSGSTDVNMRTVLKYINIESASAL
jgi:hypothetical protein